MSPDRARFPNYILLHPTSTTNSHLANPLISTPQICPKGQFPHATATHHQQLFTFERPDSSWAHVGSVVTRRASRRTRDSIDQHATRVRPAKRTAERERNRAPYDYHFVRDANNKVTGLEIYEEEAGIVRLVFTWYANGDTMKAIARRREAAGHPTPGERAYANRGAKGIWGPQTIKNIIGSETYCGVWHFGSRSIPVHKPGNAKPLYRPAPAELHIKVKVQAIVPRELWEVAQARRKQNKLMAIRNGKRENLMRGLIKCKCGLRTYGEVTNHNNRYYRCPKHGYTDGNAQSRLSTLTE
jgi:hypothetical protein